MKKRCRIFWTGGQFTGHPRSYIQGLPKKKMIHIIDNKKRYRIWFAPVSYFVRQQMNLDCSLHGKIWKTESFEGKTYYIEELPSNVGSGALEQLQPKKRITNPSIVYNIPPNDFDIELFWWKYYAVACGLIILTIILHYLIL